MKIKRETYLEDIEAFAPRADCFKDFELLVDMYCEGKQMELITLESSEGEILALCGTIQMDWGTELYVIPSEKVDFESQYSLSFIRAMRELVDKAVDIYDIVYAHCPAMSWEKWLGVMGFELDLIYSLEDGSMKLRYVRERY